MKILVPLKRVADPDNANKIKLSATGQGRHRPGWSGSPTPSTSTRSRAALRLTENGTNPKVRAGEVVVVTFGPKETEQTLRAALATGADRAIRVDVGDDELDGDLVARAPQGPRREGEARRRAPGHSRPSTATRTRSGRSSPSTSAGRRRRSPPPSSEETGALLVGREVDGGVIALPRQAPRGRLGRPRASWRRHSVYVEAHAPDHKYNDGVRFAALMAIMAAKKKPLAEVKLAELAADQALKVQYAKFELARPKRARRASKVKSRPNELGPTKPPSTAPKRRVKRTWPTFSSSQRPSRASPQDDALAR